MKIVPRIILIALTFSNHHINVKREKNIKIKRNPEDREFKSQSGQTNDYKIGIIR
jgi:hypothetical protein